MLAEAKKASTQMINEAKEAAQNEADKIAAAAQASIEQEKNAAINELKNQVATLSIDIAQKVLQEELADQKKQQSLVEKLVNDIEIK